MLLNGSSELSTFRNDFFTYPGRFLWISSAIPRRVVEDPGDHKAFVFNIF
jgi:hypothetical protein